MHWFRLQDFVRRRDILRQNIIPTNSFTKSRGDFSKLSAFIWRNFYIGKTCAQCRGSGSDHGAKYWGRASHVSRRIIQKIIYILIISVVGSFCSGYVGRCRPGEKWCFGYWNWDFEQARLMSFELIQYTDKPCDYSGSDLSDTAITQKVIKFKMSSLCVVSREWMFHAAGINVTQWCSWQHCFLYSNKTRIQ